MDEIKFYKLKQYNYTNAVKGDNVFVEEVRFNSLYDDYNKLLMNARHKLDIYS